MDHEAEASAQLRWDSAHTDPLSAGSNRVVVLGSTPFPTATVESSSSGNPTSQLLLTLARTLPVLSLHCTMFPQDRNCVPCTPGPNACCRPSEYFLIAPTDAKESRQRRP